MAKARTAHCPTEAEIRAAAERKATQKAACEAKAASEDAHLAKYANLLQVAAALESGPRGQAPCDADNKSESMFSDPVRFNSDQGFTSSQDEELDSDVAQVTLTGETWSGHSTQEAPTMEQLGEELMETTESLAKKLFGKPDLRDRLNARTASIIPPPIVVATPIRPPTHTDRPQSYCPSEAEMLAANQCHQARLSLAYQTAPPCQGPPRGPAPMAGPRMVTPATVWPLGAIPKNLQLPQEAFCEAWRSTATSASQGTNAAADVNNNNQSKGNASQGTSAASAAWEKHTPAPKGTKRPHQASPATPSTSRQAYSAAAATRKDKNYLIHVYETRDELRPFRYEEELCLF
jgi:hypothetical protein